MQITKCFEVLQVESNAPWQVVKNSYYNLAKKLHPDLNSSSPEAETRLKEINQAFQVLRSHFTNQVSTSLVKEGRNLKNWESGVFPPITYSRNDHAGVESVMLLQLQGGKQVEISDWLD